MFHKLNIYIFKQKYSWLQLSGAHQGGRAWGVWGRHRRSPTKKKKKAHKWKEANGPQAPPSPTAPPTLPAFCTGRWWGVRKASNPTGIFMGFVFDVFTHPVYHQMTDHYARNRPVGAKWHNIPVLIVHKRNSLPHIYKWKSQQRQSLTKIYSLSPIENDGVFFLLTVRTLIWWCRMTKRNGCVPLHTTHKHTKKPCDIQTYTKRHEPLSSLSFTVYLPLL